MTENIIYIHNLSACYGEGSKRIEALKDVFLEVRQGEIFGLLGPNGAGKTTLLSCIEGLKTPAHGEVYVNGIDVSENPTAAKGMLGIQLQKTALLDDLTVAELVEVYAALYEIYLEQVQIENLLTRFELLDQRGKLARRLSGGQVQRLSLALAVASDPEILLLDEPTEALDPRARRSIWEIIREMHTDGRTIIITTHSMEEAEALCGRVAIIDQGRVIACGTPARLVAELDASPVLKTSLNLPQEQIRGIPSVENVRYSGQYIEIETSEPHATLAALNELAGHVGQTVGDIVLRQPNLEDVFLSLTGKPLSN